MRKNDKPPPAAPNTLSQSIWSTRAYRNYWFQIWNKSRISTRAKVGNSWARIPAGRWRKPWTLIRRSSRPIWQTYPHARYEPSQISNCVGRHLSSRRVMAYGNLKGPRKMPRMAPEIWWVNVDFEVWYPRFFFNVFLIRRSPLSQLVGSSWNKIPINWAIIVLHPSISLKWSMYIHLIHLELVWLCTCYLLKTISLLWLTLTVLQIYIYYVYMHRYPSHVRSCSLSPVSISSAPVFSPDSWFKKSFRYGSPAPWPRLPCRTAWCPWHGLHGAPRTASATCRCQNCGWRNDALVDLWRCRLGAQVSPDRAWDLFFWGSGPDRSVVLLQNLLANDDYIMTIYTL